MSPVAPTRHRVSVKSAGDRAFLVDLGTLEAAMGVRRQLEAHPPPGLVDIVAAATTVLVVAQSPRFLLPLMRHVRSLDLEHAPGATGRLIDVPVHYDGEDLREVAAHLGMSAEAVVEWHSRTRWTAAFAGFAPGFVYLAGDSNLRVPRHGSPRTAVPPGSVALADNFSAVYPRSSPGGWQLIGSTPVTLWDETLTDPALIHPGDRVRFTAEAARIRISDSRPSAASNAPGSPDPAGLRVLHPGASATVQDSGRPGYASLGVGASGAMDRGAFARANEIVGNAHHEAALELLGEGFRALAVRDQVMAVTGAATEIEIRRRTDAGKTMIRRPAPGAPFPLLAGEELAVSAAAQGMWSYLAVRGGISVPEVLGSRSRDTHSGLGPAPLAVGDEVPVHPAAISAVVSDEVLPPREWCADVQLRVVAGPREDWFTEAAVARFYSAPWIVSNQFSRTAARLTGPALDRAITAELQSEGLVRGSVQVPTDGQPLIFSADHPVTGGYPVIGVIADADLDAAAQIGPGTTVRFVRAELPVEEEWEQR